MTVVTEPPPSHADKSLPASRGKPVMQPVEPPFDLAALVREHQAGVWRYLRYLGADAPEADDLTQETFLAVARSTLVEQSPAQTSGYLRTVAYRQLLMLRRKQRRRVSTVELDAADSVWAESFDAERANGDAWDDHVEAARRCVEKLEGRARRAVDLMYREGAGREAIAQALEMTADGVKTLLRRTRAKLRECIENQLGPAAEA